MKTPYYMIEDPSTSDLLKVNQATGRAHWVDWDGSKWKHRNDADDFKNRYAPTGKVIVIIEEVSTRIPASA